MDAERDPYEGGIKEVYSKRLDRPPCCHIGRQNSSYCI